MKILWNKFRKNLKAPPSWVKIVTFIVMPISAIASICMLFIDYKETPLAVIAYILFGTAAISLSYGTYLIIIILPKIKESIVRHLEKNVFTDRLLHNYGFRTIIFAVGSFAMNIAFAVFNGYTGIKNRSVWFGALAGYYISLAFLRGGVLNYHKKQIVKKEETLEADECAKTKIYRNSGIVLLILNIALMSAVAQMIFSDAHFTYIGLTVFAYAAYSFYKIVMAIVNLFRANKHPDLTIRAVRKINLADAAVSVLALQTALLAAFSDQNINVSLMNGITGIAVCTFTAGLGIYMIIAANRKMKTFRQEKK